MNNADVIKKCMSEINSASDRACAIVSVTLFDNLLTELLKDCFGPTQQSKDPIDSITFDAKVNLAYRIGILESDEYSILNKINEIRNIFAHNPHAGSFRYPKVKTKMLELKDTRVLYSIINNPTRTYEPPGGWDDHRSVFVFAVYYMLCFLANLRIEPIKMSIKPNTTSILDYIFDDTGKEKKPS